MRSFGPKKGNLHTYVNTSFSSCWGKTAIISRLNNLEICKKLATYIVNLKWSFQYMCV